MIFEIDLNSVLTPEMEESLKTHSLEPVGAALIVKPLEVVRRYHKIVSGETLGGIAKKYKVNLVELARINNITNPHIIRAGEILEIP